VGQSLNESKILLHNGYEATVHLTGLGSGMIVVLQLEIVQVARVVAAHAAGAATGAAVHDIAILQRGVRAAATDSIRQSRKLVILVDVSSSIRLVKKQLLLLLLLLLLLQRNLLYVDSYTLLVTFDLVY